MMFSADNLLAEVASMKEKIFVLSSFLNMPVISAQGVHTWESYTSKNDYRKVFPCWGRGVHSSAAFR
jgi:hypothetical protein